MRVTYLANLIHLDFLLSIICRYTGLRRVPPVVNKILCLLCYKKLSYRYKLV